ncbi:nuclear transport factor 2 family protein [Patiriisocius hiemis]|uniref:Nuclear transport factor 2 family protein n=1 Tax=Patiriisocius hiemis TaxID=3075604 RepID=A0ABU2YBP3_9FLAO|nr:nuclear transport factor 2 family protein [Constantimarinum sp. W242]MDT0555059.1 nuclear transport factor 2 family protein [Constantimarinum sp. W242]
MKTFIVALSLVVTGMVTAQDNFTKEDAKGIVDTFFEGFHKGDTAVMRSVLIKEVPLQTVATNQEGKHMMSNGSLDNLLNAIANRPAEQKWEEKLLDYTVQIDGNLAHVWTPYEFWLNGNFSHCGANAFTLAKTDNGWKIIHLIDSRRRSSCKQG